MTTYAPVLIAKHATLAASVADTVTVNRAVVEVANRGSVPLFFRVDGTAPTVAGDDCYVVAPGGALQIPGNAGSVTTVKVIASAACDYSVTGY